MVAITLRADLTRGLTNEEIDANMTNLKVAAEAAALTASWSGITGKPATLAGFGITDAQPLLVSGTSIKTVNGQSVLGSGNIQIDGGVTSFNTRTGAVTLGSSDVTTALGFTPYNSTNPSGYITGSGNAATATALQTARTINGVSFNGTANITVADSTKLPLSGGTLTGPLIFDSATSPNTQTIQFGDNTGWTLRYMTSVSGTLTERFRFVDNGAFNAVGAITQNGNQVLHAANYSSYALPLSGGTLSGDLTINHSSASIKAGMWDGANVRVESVGRPLYVVSYGGDISIGRSGESNFVIGNTGISFGGNQVLHAGNYTSYSPSLSGNYKNIGVGGLYSRYNYNESTWITDATSAYTLSPDYGTTTVAMHQSHGHFGDWATTLTMSGYERYGAYQISGWYNSATPQLAVRNYNQSLGGWTSWTRLLSAANFSSYALPLSGGTLSGYLYAPKVIINNNSDISWGGDYSDGKPTIAASASVLHFYPTGNVSGATLLLSATATNSVQALQQNGNQVLHAGNYTNYLNNSFMRAIGYPSSSNDWNSLGNLYPNTVEQVDPSNFSSTSNGPTAASYTYGTLLNFSSQSSSQAQIFISHAGNDLIFRGGWGGASWQTWNKVLTNQNYTSYSPSLTGSGASGTWGINITGTASGNIPRSGSWLGDLASYGYTREHGISMTGGSEFVVLSKNGQGYTLVDGSYLAFEGGGFYSSYTSSGGTLYGFYADSASSLNFNTTAVKLSGNQVLHAGNISSYALPLSGGTLTNATKIKAGHGNTRLQLHYNHDDADTTSGYAGYLTLWASEPGISYAFTGIGGNINLGGQYYGRATSGQSYGVYLRFDTSAGQTEFWNTTGAVGVIGGQGTRRAYIDANGDLWATSSAHKVIHAGNVSSYVSTANTTNVLNATAGAALGAVGTYAFMSCTVNTAFSEGATVSGSQLRYRSAASYSVVQGIYFTAASSSSAPSGTWMLMGKIDFAWEYYGVQSNHSSASSLWLRIS